jgi:hypothetical protein
MRPYFLALLLFVLSCRGQSADSARNASDRPHGRVVFALTRLDGQRLPTAYAIPRGRYLLRAATLTLDPSGEFRWQTERLLDPDTTGGHTERATLVGTYRLAGPDSLVFPDGGAEMPEFFGRLDGHGGLRIVAHPLPTAAGGPSRGSVAAQLGGAHVWEFHVR